jgi:hypothetical protein
MNAYIGVRMHAYRHTQTQMNKKYHLKIAALHMRTNGCHGLARANVWKVPIYTRKTSFTYMCAYP